MNAQTPQEILQQRLVQVLSPTFLEITDESHLHVGHVGAKNGGGHFKIAIASEKFRHKNALDCHRLIYAALGNLMQKEIHALQINIRQCT
jgi:BolA protein